MKNGFLRAICLAMSAIFIVTLASCGSSDTTPTTDLDTQTQQETLAPETTQESTDVSESETAAEVPTELPTEAMSEAESQAVTETQDKKPETTAEIVEYYNTAINRVKPEAKSITENYERNTQVKDLDLSSLKMLVNLANSLIEKNMGDKPEATNRVMTSRADKNAYFVVEGKDWSSKLTASDVKSASLTEKDGVYTITLNLKDVPASDSTTKGSGHVGKAMSVVEVDKIYSNAGGAKNIIKNVKTGNPDCKIVVKVDKQTGNVTHANFYMPWELALTAMGIDVTVTFAIEQDYDIAW